MYTVRFAAMHVLTTIITVLTQASKKAPPTTGRKRNVGMEARSKKTERRERKKNTKLDQTIELEDTFLNNNSEGSENSDSDLDLDFARTVDLELDDDYSEGSENNNNGSDLELPNDEFDLGDEGSESDDDSEDNQEDSEGSESDEIDPRLVTKAVRKVSFLSLSSSLSICRCIYVYTCVSYLSTLKLLLLVPHIACYIMYGCVYIYIYICIYRSLSFSLPDVQ